MKKVNIGCGYKKLEGYINVDVVADVQPDILIESGQSVLALLPSNEFDEVLANDVLEHIPHSSTMNVLLDWAALLKPAGNLVLQTSLITGIVDIMRSRPCFETEYNFMRCLFGFQAHHGDFHYTSFTKATLHTYLVAAGFHVPKFSVKDLWLISCVAEKVSDWRALADPDGDDANFVVESFRRILKRDVDEASIDDYVSRLASGELTRESVIRGLICAPENLYKIGAELDAA